MRWMALCTRFLGETLMFWTVYMRARIAFYGVWCGEGGLESWGSAVRVYTAALFLCQVWEKARLMA